MLSRPTRVLNLVQSTFHHVTEFMCVLKSIRHVELPGPKFHATKGN